MKFHKTIRFKLTFWYSLLFLISNLIFILIANFIITEHYNDRLPKFLKNNPSAEIMIVPLQPGDSVSLKQAINQTRENDLKQIQKILYLSSLVIVVLSFGSGYFIAEWMLRPLKKINQTTKEINAQNLDRKIEHEDTGDEISEMINNINDMIARLNNSFSLQKQFVENASHELKTPLAIMKINLDLAQLNQEKSYLETALKSTKLMDKLIEDLLLLSLADRDIKLEDIKLKEIIQEAVNQLKIVAENKNLILKFESDNNNQIIKGNKALLQRAFMNLIENAINYSKEKGEITVKLKENIIKIVDNGIGIPQDKLDKVFERFYRVDKSRSRKSGGTGLGLAITKKIIDLHKGKISINSVLNLGTEVMVIL